MDTIRFALVCACILGTGAVAAILAVHLCRVRWGRRQWPR